MLFCLLLSRSTVAQRLLVLGSRGPVGLFFIILPFLLMDDSFVTCLEVLQCLIDSGVTPDVAIGALHSFVSAPENYANLAGVTGFRLADAGDFGACIRSFGGLRFAVDFDDDE